MADVYRGRGRGRGRARGRGVEHEEEAPLYRHRDQRDLEIAAMGRRIQELERQLAAARMGSTDGGEGEESDSRDSSATDEGDEDYNPWADPNHERDQRQRPETAQTYQTLGMKIDLLEFDGKSHPDEFID